MDTLDGGGDAIHCGLVHVGVDGQAQNPMPTRAEVPALQKQKPFGAGFQPEGLRFFSPEL